MRIKDYLNEVLGIIAKNPYIKTQNISFEERPPNAAYLSGLLIFIDGSKLYIKEFVNFKSEGAKILKYGYSYLTKDGSLVFRYDNALDPKARRLSTYPEHKHVSKKLLPAKRLSLEEILKEVSESLQKISDLKTIADRISESVESYEAYSKKRKSKKRQ